MDRTTVEHPSRRPEIGALLAVLETHQLRYVLVGSVAAAVYGAAVQPGDLDIVPDQAPDNLGQLVAALRQVEARPTGDAGRWVLEADGERRWLAQPAFPPPDGEAGTLWQPDPAAVETLDHLFKTRYGNFDVVPVLAGSYDDLIRRAIQHEVVGHTLYVAHPDDLLATLTVPRRPKDADRVRALRAWQRQQPGRR